MKEESEDQMKESNVSVEVTTEPWVMFGGQSSRFLAGIQHLTFISVGKLMVASNFSLPDNMKFGEAQIISIMAYSIMLVIGLTTNSTSLYHLIRERLVKRDRNRMSLLLIHLSVADLLVSICLCCDLLCEHDSVVFHPQKNSFLLKQTSK